MKISIQKIKSSIFGTRLGERSHGMNFSRDWLLGLSVFAIVLISIFVFGIYILFNIDKNIETPVEIKNYVETINRSELQNILDEYNIKRDIFSRLLSKKIKFVDPSL